MDTFDETSRGAVPPALRYERRTVPHLQGYPVGKRHHGCEECAHPNGNRGSHFTPYAPVFQGVPASGGSLMNMLLAPLAAPSRPPGPEKIRGAAPRMAQLPSPQMSAAAIAPCRNRQETLPPPAASRTAGRANSASFSGSTASSARQFRPAAADFLKSRSRSCGSRAKLWCDRGCRTGGRFPAASAR